MARREPSPPREPGYAPDPKPGRNPGYAEPRPRDKREAHQPAGEPRRGKHDDAGGDAGAGKGSQGSGAG